MIAQYETPENARERITQEEEEDKHNANEIVPTCTDVSANEDGSLTLTF
jgi:hypothetical protein